MTKPFLYVGVILAVVVVAGAVSAMWPPTDVEESSTAKHNFVIDVPMERVRKILVRTNAAKKIVAMADAELLDQDWLQMKFEIDGPILRGDWNLDGKGQLKVRTNDDYIGQHDITLDQSIDIVPQRLHVTNDLSEAVGPIREYSSLLNLTPDENGNARFDTSLSLRIKTSANWMTRGMVKKGIRQAAGKSLRRQEHVLREIVAEHADKLIILPQGNVKKPQ